MNCSKCQSEDQNGKYCENCGHQLEEPCPECGQWEPIGRPVCLTKVEDIKKELAEAVKKAGNFSLGIFVAFLACPFIAIFIISPKYGFLIPKYGHLLGWVISGSILISVCLWIVLSVKLINSVEKKAEEKFFADHPDYKEILEKAGEL